MRACSQVGGRLDQANKYLAIYSAANTTRKQAVTRKDAGLRPDRMGKFRLKVPVMWRLQTGTSLTEARAMPDIDTSLFFWINATAASPAWLVPLARFASTELPQWMVAGTVGAFIVGDARIQRAVLRILWAMAIAWVISRLGQQLFPMPRPFVVGVGTSWMAHGGSPGFPSTHASVACAFAFAMAASSERIVVSLVALVLAGMVAWSRVCLGLHFPIDAVAGAVVGMVAGWLSGIDPSMVLRTRVAHE